MCVAEREENMDFFKGVIRFPSPKREPDNEKYVVEYTDKNIFEGVVGQMALDLLDGLVETTRKAIEDLENGKGTYYEITRTAKIEAKCGKSCYLCKVQLRHAEGGIDRGADAGNP